MTTTVTSALGNTGANPVHAETLLSRWIINFTSADTPGIVHAITGAIVSIGGNILELQQFASEDTGNFFIRLEIAAATTREALAETLSTVEQQFGGHASIDVAGRKMRTLILASKAGHCLHDLLYRMKSSGVPIEVPLVMANHDALSELAAFYGVPFDYRPIASPADKAAFEEAVLQTVDEQGIELVVLARYMQILSPELCAALEGRAINIHHSFLPGFKGANPYKQAHERGVKLIGATAHFVTSDLDEGPIIEQNVTRVDHSKSPAQLRSIGQDIESRTLRQAVTWFAEHRVFLDAHRTIVFQ